MNTLFGTVANSDHIDCYCDCFDYTCWSIQLDVGVARVQVTVKFVDQHLGCHASGLSFNDATIFAIPQLGVFLCGLQHSVPLISHIVSY